MNNICKVALGALVAGVLTIAASGGDGVMTKSADGTYVVNTTTLGKDVKGYRGPTPLLVHIKKGKVVKVEALANKETPRYFEMLKGSFLKSWDGASVKNVGKMDVDAHTGATFSAKAVKANVKLAVDYYNAHK